MSWGKKKCKYFFTREWWRRTTTRQREAGDGRCRSSVSFFNTRCNGDDVHGFMRGTVRNANPAHYCSGRTGAAKKERKKKKRKLVLAMTRVGKLKSASKRTNMPESMPRLMRAALIPTRLSWNASS